MPKRISRNIKDANLIGAAVVEAATSEQPPTDRETISRIMAEMGRKGGKIGGKKSLETMTAKQRTARAKQAAKARWNKNKHHQK